MQCAETRNLQNSDIARLASSQPRVRKISRPELARFATSAVSAIVLLAGCDTVKPSTKEERQLQSATELVRVTGVSNGSIQSLAFPKHDKRKPLTVRYDPKRISKAELMRAQVRACEQLFNSFDRQGDDKTFNEHYAKIGPILNSPYAGTRVRSFYCR